MREFSHGSWVKAFLNAAMASFVFLALAGIGHAVRIESPAWVADEFFRLLRTRQYEQAAELLAQSDRKNIQAAQTEAARMLAEYFAFMRTDLIPAASRRGKPGEIIFPEQVAYFVPGQYHVLGGYAMVFTRETYEINPAMKGPVQDDPRKLWIDPSNDLSRIREEAYFKQWWLWEGNNLSMPGVLWLVRENRQWRIDLFSAKVPRKAFRVILKAHFGWDVFEETNRGAGTTGTENEIFSGAGVKKPAKARNK